MVHNSLRDASKEKAAERPESSGAEHDEVHIPSTGAFHDLPRWIAFNATDRPTMVIDNESRLVNDPIREQRLVMFKAHDYA